MVHATLQIPPMPASSSFGRVVRQTRGVPSFRRRTLYPSFRCRRCRHKSGRARVCLKAFQHKKKPSGLNQRSARDYSARTCRVDRVSDLRSKCCWECLVVCFSIGLPPREVRVECVCLSALLCRCTPLVRDTTHRQRCSIRVQHGKCSVEERSFSPIGSITALLVPWNTLDAAAVAPQALALRSIELLCTISIDQGSIPFRRSSRRSARTVSGVGPSQSESGDADRCSRCWH